MLVWRNMIANSMNVVERDSANLMSKQFQEHEEKSMGGAHHAVHPRPSECIEANLMLHVRQEMVFAKLLVQLLNLVCVCRNNTDCHVRTVGSQGRSSADVCVFVPCVCGAAVSVCSFPVRGHECARSLVSFGVLASADGNRYLLTRSVWEVEAACLRQGCSVHFSRVLRVVLAALCYTTPHSQC